MVTNQFKKAERKKSKLRLGITGPSGSGKTYAALTLAKAMGGKIAAIDTENGSMSLYENMCDFDVIDMAAPYTPQRMVEYIKMAEANGYDVLIIDSITHEWSGPGGCIEMNDTAARTKFKGNTWSAWSVTKPMHRALLDTIIASPMHIITTLRSKTETAQEGRNVVKLGMKAEQDAGYEYEMTVVLDIVHEGHYALASKDRTGIFTDKPAMPITEETGKQLMAWLDSGAEPTPEPAKPKTEPPVITPERQKETFEKASLAIQGATTVKALQQIRPSLKLRYEQSLLTDEQYKELDMVCGVAIVELSKTPADQLPA